MADGDGKAMGCNVGIVTTIVTLDYGECVVRKAIAICKNEEVVRKKFMSDIISSSSAS